MLRVVTGREGIAEGEVLKRFGKFKSRRNALRRVGWGKGGHLGSVDRGIEISRHQ